MLDGALIGCGFFAQNHLHAWQDLSARARLIAVCDTDADKARAAAEQFGIPRWYDDARAMFAAERLDFVDIATTMPSHGPLVELAAAHRVPIIVQKPLAPSWDDCVAIVEAAERADVTLMVHENFRFQTPMRRVADILSSGAIGEPRWARISFRTGYDVFANQPYLLDEAEFVVLDLGIHLLDLARVFMGEVAHVSCELQRQHPRARADDTATMLLRHVGGAVSVVDCTYLSRDRPDPFPQTLLHIEGAGGAIRLGRDFALEVTVGDTMTHEYAGSPLLPWTSEPWHVAQESVLNTTAHFVDCLEHRRVPVTSGRDNLCTYALVRAAYQAAASGRVARPVTARHAGGSHARTLAHRLVDQARAEGLADANGVMLDLRSESDTLVISCSGIGPAQVTYARENGSKTIQTHKLFVSDSRSLWYYDGIEGVTASFDETVAVVDAIRELLGDRRAYAIGTSAGGYMALTLGARLGLDRVLALSPQTTIRAAWRKAHGEYRWANLIDRVHELIGAEETYLIRPMIDSARATPSGGQTEFHVVTSEHNELDVAYVAMISDCPRVKVYKVPDVDHNVAAAIHRRGKFYDLMTSFIGSKADEVGDAITRVLTFDPAASPA